MTDKFLQWLDEQIAGENDRLGKLGNRLDRGDETVRPNFDQAANFLAAFVKVRMEYKKRHGIELPGYTVFTRNEPDESGEERKP